MKSSSATANSSPLSNCVHASTLRTPNPPNHTCPISSEPALLPSTHPENNPTTSDLAKHNLSLTIGGWLHLLFPSTQWSEASLRARVRACCTAPALHLHPTRQWLAAGSSDHAAGFGGATAAGRQTDRQAGQGRLTGTASQPISARSPRRPRQIEDGAGGSGLGEAKLRGWGGVLSVLHATGLG